ncbi:MAG: NAD(P)-dependent oxidoreductase [Desulfarculaceae bacterium]|nr:NAD(P)-dependent oxidoreductase [Desulfarculaceae bacterium]MCF8049107.1 NAD(P)-dependent oxidoreductase [Desulfarculaceae bacterium]MCF8063936.1 NAD(P)-dependent oxidoreductase [Desulfarculaceae bacterium]MCF8099445.1 NAD(P)-dependent oxidoreductase [Desulfarculaceae bacterium]MCF8122900.1 NAD(P)-dependent oxidoreductase [Desulfarculaceae bacterium]
MKHADWAHRPVIITGAAGFLGRHLISALAKAGARVLALDQAAPPDDLPSQVQWRQVDLMNPQGMAQGLEQGPGPAADTALFHFAALSMPVDCARDPQLARALNEGMATALGRAWLERGGRQMVFASSALVYTPVEDGSNISEDGPVMGRNPYTEAKLAAEQGLTSLAAQGGLALQIVRLSNVYGPGAHSNTVVLEAMEMARAGQTPIMRRPGEELDLLYIDDVIQGLLRLAALEPVVGCRIVNLATGKAWRVAQMAAEISRLAGVEPPPDDESQPGYGYRLVLDNSLLRRLTGWEPQTEVTQGLAFTWSAYNA